MMFALRRSSDIIAHLGGAGIEVVARPFGDAGAVQAGLRRARCAVEFRRHGPSAG